jgi:N-acetylmuramate 1-kinase
MADRPARIAAFLAAAGWGEADRVPLADDASFRRYDRILDTGRRAVLMDAPPEKENVRPFVRICRHLRGLGYSAPDILAEDIEAGLLLLEDLGDDTFTRLLAGGEAEAPLYALATDLLIDLHRRPPKEAVPDGLPAYDDAALVREATLLTDWYVPAVTGAPLPQATAREYEDLWRIAFRHLRGVPETLVLRDFHVDNLIRLPGREGVRACGLLDFQDALRGPAAYDFVSLVEDARRDVSDALRAALRDRYLSAFPGLDAADFDRAMAVLGAQRHAKVIGIFTRLCRRDGKPGYLRHIPRVWRLLERAAAHPALAPMRAWLDAHIPPHARRVPEERVAS